MYLKGTFNETFVCYNWTFVNFQTRSSGNCLFHAYRGCLRLRKSTDTEAPYYPCRYFRRHIVWFMVHNRDLLWKAKHLSLRAKYGVEGNDVFGHPISFKEYLRSLLKRSFWGDDVVLYVLTCLFSTSITVINAVTLDEYRIRHTLPLSKVDVILVFNGANHYSYAGRWTFVR